MSDEVEVAREGHVIVVTINRPERMNALNQAAHDTLRETWTSLHEDRSVRAIVITGAGDRAFCTGMDLQDHAARGGPRPSKPNVHDELRQTPLNCDVWLPTIAAVNGVCVGGGFHFVADADVVVAASTASFIDTHVSVGQVTALEPIQLLPRIGFGNALKMAVLGRKGRISAVSYDSREPIARTLSSAGPGTPGLEPNLYGTRLSSPPIVMRPSAVCWRCRNGCSASSASRPAQPSCSHAAASSGSVTSIDVWTGTIARVRGCVHRSDSSTKM